MPDFDKQENAGPLASVVKAQTSPDVVLVYMTFPDADVAATVGEVLVGDQLAACVNILPGMVSIYRWQGETHRDAEAVMIVKTRRTLADAVMAAARERHPYENPAMLVLPVIGGAPQFLDWIMAGTQPAVDG